MDIFFDKKTAVEGDIKIVIAEKDYLDKVEKAIKDYAKKANIRGFRVGKVPLGYIKKLHGNAFLIQTVYEIADNALRKYISEKDIRILGEPLVNEENQKGVDWENQKEFEFVYDIGFIAVNDININAEVQVTKYIIDVEEKNIEEVIQQAKERFATRTNKEKVDKQTELRGLLAFGEKQFQTGFFSPSILDEKIRKNLEGKAKGEVINISFSPKYKVATLEKMLDIPEDTLHQLDNEATLKIDEVIQVRLPSLNQNFFINVFPNEEIENEEMFRAKIKTIVAENYNTESKKILDRDLIKAYVNKTNPQLPEDFLKRFFLQKDSQLTKENLEKDFLSYKKEIQWEILANQILKINHLEVSSKDVEKKLKEELEANLGGDDKDVLTDEKVNEFIRDSLYKDKERKLYTRKKEMISRERALDFIIGKAKVKEKKSSWDNFVEYVQGTKE